MKKGLISVVMGVHNEQENYLRAAFNSIFSQTYKDMELIIVDDASDAACKSIINELCDGKTNVRVIHNETNIGLTKSLNKGLDAANGEFIARMDADDISLPDRFEKQINFFEKNQDVEIVGTGVVSFGEETKFMSPPKGYTNDEAQCNLFFSSTLCHPSVMIRKQFLDKHNLRYDESVKKGQDYDMWERCGVYGKLAVIKDILLFYRTHPKQITSTNKADQDLSAENIRKRRLGRIGISPSEKEYRCHELLASGVDKSISPSDVEEWISKVILHNKKSGLVDSKSLQRNLQSRFLLYKFRNRVGLGVKDIIPISKILISRVSMRNRLRRVEKDIAESVHKNNIDCNFKCFF